MRRTGTGDNAVKELPRKSVKLRFDPVLGVAILVTWVAIFPRLIPHYSTDRGIFVSVGERLLAGDALYSGVYDNKDPLFYYLVAAQRAAGTWAEVAAEAVLVGIAATSTYVIGRMVVSRWLAAAIALIGVPMILTGAIGAFYSAGATHLPGISIVMAASAAVARGRPILCGVCLAILFFIKLIFIPVALLAVGCLITRHNQKSSELVKLVIAAAATALGVVGLLAVRGELWPYVDVQLGNIAYSQNVLFGGKTGFALLAAHLDRVRGGMMHELIVIALAITIAGIPLFSFDRHNARRIAIFVACCLTALGSVVVLAFTGMWEHHNQIWYIPAIFAMLGLAPLLELAAEQSIATAAVVALTAHFLSGSVDWNPFRDVLMARGSFNALSELSPETKRLLTITPPGSYARLGRGDDMGHAIGIRQWKLLCQVPSVLL